VSVHPQEGLLMAARAYQETAEGRAHLRERVVAEHRLARLGQLGMGQARYLGRAKTRCHLLLLATIANLRRVWNWVQAQETSCPAAVGEALAAAG
jgi:IS5 family transposase